jgi:hypothetical protein
MILLAYEYDRGWWCDLRYDVGPANESPMLLDTSGKSDLLADFCARRRCEGQPGRISLHGNDLGTCGSRTNVDHLYIISALSKVSHTV